MILPPNAAPIAWWPEAHAQDRQLAGEVPGSPPPRCPPRPASTGPGETTSRSTPPRCARAMPSTRDLVVAKHLDLRAQLAEVLHEVVGEAVVVVDHQELHGLASDPVHALDHGEHVEVDQQAQLAAPDSRTRRLRLRAMQVASSASTAFTSTTTDCSTTKSARYDLAERAALVAGRHRHVAREADLALGEFDLQRGGVGALQQAGAEHALHLDGGADDLVREIVVLDVVGLIPAPPRPVRPRAAARAPWLRFPSIPARAPSRPPRRPPPARTASGPSRCRCGSRSPRPCRRHS